MISEREHPELARALNNMTTVINRDHTDKEWKQALMRVLAAFAVEIIHPVIPITDRRLGPVKPGPIDDGGATMKKILENLEKQYPHHKDPNIHPCDTVIRASSGTVA